jgi:hypothetical protein
MLFKRLIASLMAALVLVFSVAPRADGAFTPSEALALSEAQREGDLMKIRAVLEDKIVRQRLSDHGFSAEEVEARLSALSDGQLHDLALRVDELRVGGLHGLAIVAIFLVIVLSASLIIIYMPFYHRGGPPPIRHAPPPGPPPYPWWY